MDYSLYFSYLFYIEINNALLADARPGLCIKLTKILLFKVRIRLVMFFYDVETELNYDTELNNMGCLSPIFGYNGILGGAL